MNDLREHHIIMLSICESYSVLFYCFTGSNANKINLPKPKASSFALLFIHFCGNQSERQREIRFWSAADLASLAKTSIDKSCEYILDVTEAGLLYMTLILISS